MNIELTLFQKIAAWIVLSCFCWSVFADVGFLLWFHYAGGDSGFRWFVGISAMLCFSMVGAAFWRR